MVIVNIKKLKIVITLLRYNKKINYKYFFNYVSHPDLSFIENYWPLLK